MQNSHITKDCAFSNAKMYREIYLQLETLLSGTSFNLECFSYFLHFNFNFIGKRFLHTFSPTFLH